MKIIKIGALWCPACLIVNNNLNKIKKEYSLNIVEYDYDFDSEEVKNYEVGNILPVLIFLNDENIELKRLIGESSYKLIKETIEELE